MSYIDSARKLRPIVEKAMQSIDGNDALIAKSLYPQWSVSVDYTTAAGCPVGFKVRRAGKLWRLRQEHISQAGWEPENAVALWEQINETHAGTLEDPIPYSGNMTLVSGLYYVQDYVIYRCTRDTVNPIYHALGELVGLYVEEVAL
jgi:hypothetical protein